MIWSKSYCPYCVKAKNALAKYDPHAIEVDKRSDCKDITMALKRLTGQRTFPNIFILGRHIGGFDAVSKALREGRVQKDLEGTGTGTGTTDDK
jgi:glutaredoxin